MSDLFLFGMFVAAYTSRAPSMASDLIAFCLGMALAFRIAEWRIGRSR
jgi:hypothetical protein